MAKKLLNDPKLSEEEKAAAKSRILEKSRAVDLRAAQFVPHLGARRLKRRVSKNMKQVEKEQLVAELAEKEKMKKKMNEQVEKMFGRNATELFGKEIEFESLVNSRAKEKKHLMKRKKSKELAAQQRREEEASRHRKHMLDDTFSQAPLIGSKIDGDLKVLATAGGGLGPISRQKIQKNSRVITRHLLRHGMLTGMMEEDAFLRKEQKKLDKEDEDWVAQMKATGEFERHKRELKALGITSDEKFLKERINFVSDSEEELGFGGEYDGGNRRKKSVRSELMVEKREMVGGRIISSDDEDDFEVDDEASDLEQPGAMEILRRVEHLLPDDDEMLEASKGVFEREEQALQMERLGKKQWVVKQKKEPSEVVEGKRKLKLTPAQEGDVIEVSFVTRDEKGNILDKQEAAKFMLGDKAVLPKFSEKLTGLLPGGHVSFSMKASERGDALWDKRLIQRIPREKLDLESVEGEKDKKPLEVGKYALIFDGKQDSVAKVLEANEKFYVLDFNHPYANRTLFYDIQVKSNYGPSKDFKPSVATVQ
eukprot:TRINITY_DN24730_c0_g1_i2.p1 TRINITY_DN24730_c0_g1~~TRINITY_DN24730_c0_g1_i2.p1  ORF type:complete len:628 (+),score=222.47 TRINITY_DN24730_c0_g1_i2:274-1884(+)